MHFQYHFDNHKSHKECPGIESLSLRREMESDAAEIIVLIVKLIIIIQLNRLFISVQACHHKYLVQSQYKDTNKTQKKRKDQKTKH